MSTTELKATQWAAQHTAGHNTHGQTAIYDEATGKDIAIVYDGDKHAEFIVRAVNSHADMLEALEFAQFLEELEATHNPQDIIRLLESRGDYESGHLSTEQMLAEYQVKVALAREAAIAKAKGGAA